MSLIESKSKKILTKAIYRLASEKQKETQDVQLMVKYHKGRPEFFGMLDYKSEVGHLPVNQLYPAHMDIFGIRSQIPVFIANTIDDVCEEFKSKMEISKKDVKLLIVENEMKKKNLLVFAYKDTKFLKIYKWKEVFGEEALMRIMAKQ